MPNKKIIKQLKSLIEKFGKVLFVSITISFIVLSFICIWLAFQNICPAEKFTSFLDNINKYGNIFTITIALITVGLILNQITLAVEANKLTPRAQWTENFERYFKDQKPSSQKISSIIQTYFLKNANDIFDFLYALDTPLRIDNSEQLTNFFNVFLKGKVREFELASDGYHQNQSYKSLNTSYSITDIQKVLQYVLKATRNYQTLENDLINLYIAEVNKMIEEYGLIK
jgi:predicted restriction endonuclease